MSAPIDATDPRFAQFRDHAIRYSQDPTIKEIASEVAGIGRKVLNDDSVNLPAGELRTERAARLLRAVQENVRFIGPQPGHVNPLETIERGEGDCKSSATLLAALALSVGCDASLMAMGNDGDPSHVCALLKPNKDGPWQWAETTIPGAELGEHPIDAYNRIKPDQPRADLVAAAPHEVGAISSPNHVEARAIIVQAFQAELARAPSVFEAQMVQAVCLLETGYGHWKTTCGGGCDGSHNWGAIQARAGEPQCPCSDTRPDGSSYTQGFKTYPDDVSGVRDVLRQLYALRPTVAAALTGTKGTDVVADAMFYSHYFGGRCPNALATYGDAAKVSLAFGKGAATSSAGKACENEAIQAYADALFKGGSEIAQANGEAPPPRGGGNTLLWIGLGVGAVVLAGGAYYYFVMRRPPSSSAIPLDMYEPAEDA